ncbi:hypothetical protein EGR_10126 [Echinococcus granulosus]|uniref:Uncharacterized protein n=1 Tax=Echinococcus granulosus TaxID=6210 RepID=W6U1U0_ECHGR|nr:hypothetical protein EGR_10126 [Echinococcus granulosus]EUB55008.1 hypothetical protein EGR_10126 [Echinococcus granulosus]
MKVSTFECKAHYKDTLLNSRYSLAILSRLAFYEDDDYGVAALVWRFELGQPNAQHQNGGGG